MSLQTSWKEFEAKRAAIENRYETIIDALRDENKRLIKEIKDLIQAGFAADAITMSKARRSPGKTCKGCADEHYSLEACRGCERLAWKIKPHPEKVIKDLYRPARWRNVRVE